VIYYNSEFHLTLIHNFKSICATGLSVRIFGIACETTKSQTNYLLPEGCYPAEKRGGGKGANVVVSLLHQYLEHNYNNYKNLQFHADSCQGQNKNQYVFFYLIWRVVTGKNDSISLNFMVPGHTKSVPDQNFGAIKRAFRSRGVKTTRSASN
jgi:hypothetical protein